MSQSPTSCSCNQFVSVSHCGTIFKISINDIVVFEVNDKYIKISVRSSDKQFLIRSTLAELAEVLPGHCFIRVHRSFIININHYEKIEDGYIYLPGAKIHLHQEYKAALIKSIFLIN